MYTGSTVAPRPARSRSITQLSRPPLTSAAIFIGGSHRIAEISVHAFEQANADSLGVQSEDVADRLKRERRTVAAATNPPFGLAEKLPPGIVASVAVLVEAARGIEQHRPEEPSLSQGDAKPATEIDLGWKNDLRKGLEGLSRPGCITVDLHGVR